jgi:hypothetical protein
MLLRRHTITAPGAGCCPLRMNGTTMIHRRAHPRNRACGRRGAYATMRMLLMTMTPEKGSAPPSPFACPGRATPGEWRAAGRASPTQDR